MITLLPSNRIKYNNNNNINKNKMILQKNFKKYKTNIFKSRQNYN